MVRASVVVPRACVRACVRACLRKRVRLPGLLSLRAFSVPSACTERRPHAREALSRGGLLSGLGIYILNLGIGFLSPAGDPSADGTGV